MRYLRYDEYVDIGGTLDKTVFERVIDRACGIVDGYTYKELQNAAMMSDRVKACIRDLCECLDSNKTASKTVTSRSQTAGGVSESESYSVKTAEESNVELRDIVYDYLWTEENDNGCPLLYRGCMRD